MFEEEIFIEISPPTIHCTGQADFWDQSCLETGANRIRLVFWVALAIKNGFRTF